MAKLKLVKDDIITNIHSIFTYEEPTWVSGFPKIKMSRPITRAESAPCHPMKSPDFEKISFKERVTTQYLALEQLVSLNPDKLPAPQLGEYWTNYLLD